MLEEFNPESERHVADGAHIGSVTGVEHLVLSKRLRVAQRLATDAAHLLRSTQVQILEVLLQIMLIIEAPAALGALKVVRVDMPGGYMQLQRPLIGQNSTAKVASRFGV